jgi:hypothetical protein
MSWTAIVFIVGAVFGATISEVSRYIERRRRSELDYRLLLSIVRSETTKTAQAACRAFLEEPSQRATINLKPRRVVVTDGTPLFARGSDVPELPLDERPTQVHGSILDQTLDDLGDG